VKIIRTTQRAKGAKGSVLGEGKDKGSRLKGEDWGLRMRGSG
jgi:hypothetical protein